MFSKIKKLFKRRRRVSVERLLKHGFDREMAELAVRLSGFTMTSPGGIEAFCDSVRYVVGHNIPGSIVECGVWRGGSMMGAAETLKSLHACDRHLYLYDTFAGMTPPGEHDLQTDGTTAEQLLHEQDPADPKSVWCIAGLDDVVSNLASTRYPTDLMHFIQGPVEETLPEAAPEQIALLRLDTDWYESTRHELEHLFPRLVPGGVLILDDYGCWQGARRAVDEYFTANPTPMLLTRMDPVGRIGVTPSRRPPAGFGIYRPRHG